jgi:hypothetical protein
MLSKRSASALNITNIDAKFARPEAAPPNPIHPLILGNSDIVNLSCTHGLDTSSSEDLAFSS